MASVYRKPGSKKWWCRLKGAKKPGKWSSVQTPIAVTEDAAVALRFAKRSQDNIDKRTAGTDVVRIVADYARKWLEERAARGLASVKDDVGRINNHVLPHIGGLAIGEVRPRHIRDMVRELCKNPELAPKTIRNIFGICSAMFADIVVDELIDQTPCVLKRGELPEKMDKDPEWRMLATYEVDEVVKLITDPRILQRRRVEYALKALAGLRHGEVAGLRMRHYERDVQPLGRLAVSRTYTEKRTKTKVTRPVPVHPELARVLDTWIDDVWPEMYGRAPTVDDFIVPTLNFATVDPGDAGKVFKVDLELLGLRVDAGESRDRGGHDLRAWFISQAQNDGANRDILALATHTKKKDVMSGYTRLKWPAICEEVRKLTISLGDQPLYLAPELVTFSEGLSKKARKSLEGFSFVRAPRSMNERPRRDSNPLQRTRKHRMDNVTDENDQDDGISDTPSVTTPVARVLPVDGEE